MSRISDALQRILDFERRTVELVAGEVREIDEGWVVSTPALPAVWSLNHLRIGRPVSYGRAIELCREHHPPGAHLHLHIEHDETGERLVDRFREDGWTVEVNLHLELRHEPDHEAPSDGVIEPEEDEGLALMERWIRDDATVELTPEGLRQVVAHNRETWRARKARRFGVRLASGELGAIAILFSDGRIGQVEDVYAIPEARGHGFGRTLVTRAAATGRDGGHELVFIVADDQDWPKQLYQKVGFEPIGRSWLFHRASPSPGGP